MLAYGHFITLEHGAEAKALVAPELGGWLLRYMRHFPQLGYVDALHYSQEVVERYPNQMYAGNPLLFPLASFNVLEGQEGKYRWHADGLEEGEMVEYSMAQHGFARKSKWKVIDVSELSVELELTNTPETEKNYPFQFSHKVRYSLENSRLRFSQNIRNDSKRIMPFSAGIHPYFAAPFTSKGQRSDCRLRIPAARKMIPHGKMESFTAEPFEAQELSIADDFSGTMFLTDLCRNEVALVDRASGMEAILNWEDAPAYDFLALWSKSTDSPFFCIEPWTALPNSFGRPDGELILLDPGAQFHASMWMELREIS